MKFMFDTTAINEIVKKGIDPSRFSKEHQYFITPVQYSEILCTTESAMRQKLLTGFEVIKELSPAHVVHLHSAPFGHHPFGHGPFGGGDGKYYGEILRRLSECPGNKSKRGDGFDSLIIETCKMEMMTLVINDGAAQKVCSEMEVDWLNLGDFLAQMERTGPFM